MAGSDQRDQRLRMGRGKRPGSVPAEVVRAKDRSQLAARPVQTSLPVRLRRWQTACVPRSITIRDVPDETGAELAARAALSGRSLQEYLRARLIEMAERPDAESWLARVRARKAVTGTGVSPDEIVAFRDADRR